MDKLVGKVNKSLPAVPCTFAMDFLLDSDIDMDAVKGLDDIFDKLYAYESTGLTPDEIKSKLTLNRDPIPAWTVCFKCTNRESPVCLKCTRNNFAPCGMGKEDCYKDKGENK